MAGDRRQGSGWAQFGSQCADYYAQLAQKYRRAMWRPWMPVAPDPHAPGFDQWKEQASWAKEVAPILPSGFLRPKVSDRGQYSRGDPSFSRCQWHLGRHRPGFRTSNANGCVLVAVAELQRP
jgi:hypothetical protein